MAIKGVNLKSLIVSGFVAGWMMFLLDHYFAGIAGLFGIYPGTSDWGWMFTHQVEAILFAIPFAWPAIYFKLPGSGWLKGIIYGFLWWLIIYLILGWLAGIAGAQAFQQMAPKSADMLFTAILLHLVWGFFLGILYVPVEPG